MVMVACVGVAARLPTIKLARVEGTSGAVGHLHGCGAQTAISTSDLAKSEGASSWPSNSCTLMCMSQNKPV